MTWLCILLSSLIVSVESAARTLSANGLLNDTIIRENFAIDSITPVTSPEGDFLSQSFLATSSEAVSNLASFAEVNFTQSSSTNTFLDTLNLAAVFINSELSELFQSLSNPEEESRPIIFTFYEVNSPFFQDPNAAEDVGSVVLSVIVDSTQQNITFGNFGSPIEFKFQVTEVCYLVISYIPTLMCLWILECKQIKWRQF